LIPPLIHLCSLTSLEVNLASIQHSALHDQLLQNGVLMIVDPQVPAN
jgi:hypothetical protein